MFHASARVPLTLLLLWLLSLTSATTINNCLVTSNSGSLCSQCDAGYYITSSGATCTAYVCSAMTNCTLCDSTSTCLTCTFGYTTNAGRTGCTKIVCNDGNCSLCSSTAADSCYVCAEGYYVTSTHTCSPCSSNATHCQFCEVDYASVFTCNACMDYYYTDTSSTCALCNSSDANCYNCDSTGAGSMKCFDCATTHFISDYAAGTCTSCGDGIGVANCDGC